MSCHLWIPLKEIHSLHFPEKEILQVIKYLPSHKSPGEDGLTNKFYKHFANILIIYLTSLYGHAAFSSSLPIDLLHSVITTFPKPGKDPLSTANYRPISLLNKDINLLAKVIARRLQAFLSSLVHPDQVGFIPGRQASAAIRRVIDLTPPAQKCLPCCSRREGVW